MESPHSILKKVFGYDSFRPGQEEIVSRLLAGQDVLAVMPTGAGKSICYQVPALLLPGITIVVSPLVSLMKDQVGALVQAGVAAAFLNNSLTDNQKALMLRRAREGWYKIIYVAPERLEMPGFQRFAQERQISMVTVDEAHCISQWGQDFRPSYLRIKAFVDSLPSRPVVGAFTATATAHVRDDIREQLALQKPYEVTTSFDRPNLYFQVERTRRKDDFVIQYLRDHPGESGIIYCATRKNVDKLQELLTEYGFAATKYHAGLPADLQHAVHLVLVDVAFFLQPVEHRRAGPAGHVDHCLGALRQHARDVVEQAAAGDVGHGLHRAGFLDQLEQRLDVDAGRRQQMVSQRFTFKLSGLWVATADFENFTHQRVAVGVWAAGSQRDQHVTIRHFAAVDNF